MSENREEIESKLVEIHEIFAENGNYNAKQCDSNATPSVADNSHNPMNSMLCA